MQVTDNMRYVETKIAFWDTLWYTVSVQNGDKRVVGWGAMLLPNLNEVTGLFLQFLQSFQLHYNHVFDSACKINEYQECSLAKVRPELKPDVIAVSLPNV
jgi:hypothetical protein